MAEGLHEHARVHAGGLVTVALLKARLDEGHDHLDIFWPLIADVLAKLPSQSFATSEVQEALASTHRVAMPQDAVATLLKRATKAKYLTRESGRYHRNPQRAIPPGNIASAKAEVEQAHQQLGKALQAHAAKHGLSFESPDAALELLFTFLEEEQVGLLLGGAQSAAAGEDATRRQRAILAEFLQETIRSESPLQPIIRGMLEGLVLYHAAFLPDLAGLAKHFKDLRVAFDSVLVRQALGYEGVGMRTLMRETIALLKGSEPPRVSRRPN